MWGSSGRQDGCGCRAVFTSSRKDAAAADQTCAFGSGIHTSSSGMVGYFTESVCAPRRATRFEGLGLAYAGHEGLGPTQAGREGLGSAQAGCQSCGTARRAVRVSVPHKWAVKVVVPRKRTVKAVAQHRRAEGMWSRTGRRL